MEELIQEKLEEIYSKNRIKIRVEFVSFGSYQVDIFLNVVDEYHYSFTFKMDNKYTLDVNINDICIKIDTIILKYYRGE
jgi:hypothetical protein